MCAIEELKPNRFQPRKDFSDEDMKNLIGSIKEKGIIQPLVVRRLSEGYEIIAGERRWRAARQLGLKTVPIVIREAGDGEMAELSLVENLQRSDLNPIEEAQGYHTLQDVFGLTQEEISIRVGKDRATVANALRLLKSPPFLKKALIEKQLTAGHARAILALETDSSPVPGGT